MNNINPEIFIDKLKMQSHPEGGYFSEIYRSSLITNSKFHEGEQRSLATSIYFMLKSGQVSKFHQLKSDEIWYYHYGSSIQIYMIGTDNKLTIETLGPNINAKEKLQIVLPAGTIFGASVKDLNNFGLVGCMVNPGFDFRDFKLITKEQLQKIIPGDSDLIDLLS
jgi:predicted cupin superfamily sugar epimerase